MCPPPPPTYPWPSLTSQAPSSPRTLLLFPQVRLQVALRALLCSKESEEEWSYLLFFLSPILMAKSTTLLAMPQRHKKEWQDKGNFKWCPSWPKLFLEQNNYHVWICTAWPDWWWSNLFWSMSQIAIKAIGNFIPNSLARGDQNLIYGTAIKIQFHFLFLQKCKI